jgi:hypothetical protein
MRLFSGQPGLGQLAILVTCSKSRPVNVYLCTVSSLVAGQVGDNLVTILPDIRRKIPEIYRRENDRAGKDSREKWRFSGEIRALAER